MIPAGEVPRAVPAVDVLVVVVTYDSADVIGDLIASLPEGMAGAGRWALTVADNASVDGTEQLVRQQAPTARVVPVGWNAGFAAGINAAVAASPAFGAVLILNPDARLQPGSVAMLQRRLAHGDVGIVVPVLRRGDGSLICSLRRQPTVRGIWAEALLGGRRAGGRHATGEAITDPGAYERPTAAAWASGCALLISAACARAVGQWDESFFLYSEETDFCLRAGDAGFRLVLEPAADVVHLEGEARVSPWLWSLLTLNRARLFRKRHSRGASAAFWSGLLLREALRIPHQPRLHASAVRSLLRPRRLLREVPAAPAVQGVADPRAARSTRRGAA